MTEESNRNQHNSGAADYRPGDKEWLKYFRPRPGADILDLGAHCGPNLLPYTDLGHRVTGMELSVPLIKKFTAALHQDDPIAEFDPPRQFDEVLCTEVLEQVIDPVAILKVARASAKKNGRIYISGRTSHSERSAYGRGLPVSDLQRWLQEAGLRPVEIWSENDRTFCIAHDSNVRVIGMIRVRNESAIIGDTLEHMARFCSGGIYVYDDASTDNTADLCSSHPMVRVVVRGSYWDCNRGRAEYENRAAVLAAAQEEAGPEDWLVYLDADERIEFDWSELSELPQDVIAVRMKLFDFYITPENANEDYRARRWMGPEYRPIIFAYRNLPTLRFCHLDQREVELGSEGEIIDRGFVKHYGKAISIQQWEETCNYYSTYFPVYRAKWQTRRGKAVHTKSDFGHELIRWEDKEDKGILLTPEIAASVQSRQHSVTGQDLRILLTNHQLLDFTGSELFTFTLADFLRRMGHDATVYSPYVDKVRQPLDSVGVRVVSSLDEIRDEKFDLAHVHHNITALEVRHRFPDLPIVYLSHGVLPFLEQAPAIDLQIARFLAVSEEVRNSLVSQGIAEDRVGIFRNIVDSQRFCPSESIGETPRNALVISARIDERRETIIRQACAALGIAVKFLGGRFGAITPSQLPVLINSADIVFSLGRGAIEAMLCGRIPIVFDYLGGDGMVTPENLHELMSCNFSGRLFGNDYTVDDLVGQIRKYKRENGLALRTLALELFDAQINIASLIAIYRDFIKNVVAPLRHEDKKLLGTFIETIRETRSYTYNHLTRQALQQTKETGIELPLPATGAGPEEWRKAIRQLESQLWLNEQDPSSHHELGLLRYHSGDKLRALGHFQRALDLLPDDSRIRSNLYILYPEVITQLIADLGGRTEHEQSLETHARNLEAEIERLKLHSSNLEADRSRLETHASNLVAEKSRLTTHVANLEALDSNLRIHVANLETRNANLETHTANLEEERQRLTGWVESQRQQLAQYLVKIYAGRLSGLISQILRDGVTEIAIYGAGEVGQALISMCRAENIRIRYVVDGNKEFWGNEIDGIRIVSLAEAINDGCNAYVIASLSWAREIGRGIREGYTGTMKRRPRIFAPKQETYKAKKSAPLRPAASN